jgi:Protein of unknown function (DUF551)
MMWIPIEERLPELGRLVLTWNGTFVAIGALIGDSHHDPALFWFIDSIIKVSEDNPTHWTTWIDPPAVSPDPGP